MAEPAIVEFALYVQLIESNADGGYRLMFELEVVDGYRDPDVFRFQREADDDVFTGICSPADIADYPRAATQTTSPEGFYRGNTLDLVMASRTDALQLRDEILEEIDWLNRQMKLLENNLTPPNQLLITTRDD